MGKRGKAGAIVSHPQRHEIELCIANGIAHHLIAERYGLHRNTIGAHKARMGPERLAMLRYATGDSLVDLDALKSSEAQNVVVRAVTWMANLEEIYRRAVDLDDLQAAMRAAKEYRGYLDLQARLVGELIQGDRHLHLQVAESPQYKRLVGLVMTWCADRPELAADLSAFLEASEHPPTLIEHQPDEDEGESSA